MADVMTDAMADAIMLTDWEFCASCGGWSSCEEGIEFYSLEQE
jgi:hypothetical protein